MIQHATISSSCALGGTLLTFTLLLLFMRLYSSSTSISSSSGGLHISAGYAHLASACAVPALLGAVRSDELWVNGSGSLLAHGPLQCATLQR